MTYLLIIVCIWIVTITLQITLLANVIFKLNELDEFISFNNNEIKHIINQFTGVL